jgi:nitrate/TMAO reductase-like tetraheme cytochrome c subunit
MSTRRIILITSITFITGFILYSLFNRNEPVEKIVHPLGGQFAGSESCQSCHQTIYQTFLATPHSKTSASATNLSIFGSFKVGENVFQFNERDHVEMNMYDSGLFQNIYSGDQKIGTQRFDVVIGSGTKGQTFLSWHGNKLVQLPVSYYTPEQQWSSNPGNPTDRLILNRPVGPGCLNCHSTHFDVTLKLNEPPDYDNHKFILGIQCERCHGPAAQHVSLAGEVDPTTKGRKVVNPKFLNRKQQLDLCSQCHSGNRASTSSSFHFLPGDSLSYKNITSQIADTSSRAEVHGSQYDLLIASKCFRLSDNLTCGSCHNPHKKERGNLELFSTKCISCHSGKKEELKNCKLAEQMGDKINKNCIDCHMPVRASKKITFRVDDKKNLDSEMARTHFISIYPTQSEKIIEMLKKLNQKI